MNKLVKSNSTSGPPPTVGKRRPRFSFSRKDKEQRDQHHVRTPSGRWVKDHSSDAFAKVVPDPHQSDVADLTDQSNGEPQAAQDNALDSGPQIPPWHLNRPAVQWDISPAPGGSSSQHASSSSSGQSHALLPQNGSSTTKLHHVHTPPAPVPFPVPHQYTKNHSHSHSRSNKHPHSSSSSHKHPTMRHKPGSLYPMHNAVKPAAPYINWHLRPPDLDLPPIFMSGHAASGRVRTISNPTAVGGIAGVGANVLANPEVTPPTSVAVPTASHPPTIQPPSNYLRTQKNTDAVLGHASSHQSLRPYMPSEQIMVGSPTDLTAVGPMTRSASDPAAYGNGHDTSLTGLGNNLNLADPWGRNWAHPSPYDLGGPTGGLMIPMPGAHSAPTVPLTADAKERDRDRGRAYETIGTSRPRRRDPSPLAAMANSLGRPSHEYRKASFDGRPDDRPASGTLRHKKSGGNGYNSERERGYISDKGGYISASDNEGTSNVKRPATGLRGLLTSTSPSNLQADEPAMTRHRSDSKIGLGAAGDSTKQTFEVVGRKGAGSRLGHAPKDSTPSHESAGDHEEPKDGNPHISHPVTLQRTPSALSGGLQHSGSSRLVGHQKSHSHLGHGDPGTETDYSGTRKLSKHKHSVSHDVGEGSISHGLRRFYSRDGWGGYGTSAGEQGYRDGHFPGGSKRGGGGTVLVKIAKKLSFVGKSQKERDRERDAQERDRLLRAVEVQERERERARDRERADRERVGWEKERERERLEEQADANRRLGIGIDQDVEGGTPARSTSVMTGTSNHEIDPSFLTVDKVAGTPQSANSRPISHGQASSVSHPSPQPPRRSRTPSFSTPSKPPGSPPQSDALPPSTAIKQGDRGGLDPRSPAPKTRASLLRASKTNLEGPGSPMSFDQPLSPLGRLAASLITPRGKERERTISVSKGSTLLDSPIHASPAIGSGLDHRTQSGRESPPPQRSESPQPLPRMNLMLTNPDAPSPPASIRSLSSSDNEVDDNKMPDRPRIAMPKPTRAPPQIPVGPPDVPAAASSLLAVTPSASPEKASRDPTPSPTTSTAPIISPPTITSPVNSSASLPQQPQQSTNYQHGSQGTAIAYTDGVNTWLIPTQTLAMASPAQQTAVSALPYDPSNPRSSTQSTDPRGLRNSQRPDSLEFPMMGSHQRTSSGSQPTHYAMAQHGSRSADSLLPQSSANGHVYMPMAYPAPFMLQHLPSIPTPSSSHTPLPSTYQQLPSIPTPNSSYHLLPMSPNIHSVLGAPGPGKSQLSNVTSATSISSASSAGTSTPPPPLPKSPPNQANQLRYGYRPAQRPPLQPQTASDPPPVTHDKHLSVPVPQPARRETAPTQSKDWELAEQQHSNAQASRSVNRHDRRSSDRDHMARHDNSVFELVSPRERDRALREKEARKREERRLMEKHAREEEHRSMEQHAREDERRQMEKRAREEERRQIEKQAREEERRQREKQAREEERMLKEKQAREEERRLQEKQAREEEVRREREAERERSRRREMEQASWNGVTERHERHRSKHFAVNRLSTIPPTPPPKEGLRLSQLPEDLPSIRSSQVSSQRVSRATSRPDSSATMTRSRQGAPATLIRSRPESTSTTTSSSSGSRSSKLSKPPPTRPPPPSTQVNIAAHHLAPARPVSEDVVGIDLSIRANEAMQRDRMMKGASLIVDRPTMVEHVLGRSIPPQIPGKDQPANPQRRDRAERPVSHQAQVNAPYGPVHTAYSLLGPQPQWGYTPAPPPNMLNPLPRPPRDIDLQAH